MDAYEIPTQTCCLAHITTQLARLNSGAPVDLLFQSVAGTEAANRSFGITLDMLREGREQVLEHHRQRDVRWAGNNVMYFETGQGSALSAEAHHGVDQLTLEARAYGVARAFQPFLVNSVVGFIGPEYLYDERQIIRAGLEDHFMGKLLGLPMGCDVCYTNHAAADQNSADNLLLLLDRRGLQLFHGSSLLRRRDAELPIHQLSRCARRTAPVPSASRAGVPGMAPEHGDLSRRRTRVARFIRAAATDARSGVVPGEDGLNGLRRTERQRREQEREQE